MGDVTGSEAFGVGEPFDGAEEGSEGDDANFLEAREDKVIGLGLIEGLTGADSEGGGEGCAGAGT